MEAQKRELEFLRGIARQAAYKTVMCNEWLEWKTCAFGESCGFAHGEHELRPFQSNPRPTHRYKTIVCSKFTRQGLCPYGNRCHFIHPHQPNAYIRADRIFEVSQKHSFADMTEQFEKLLMDKTMNPNYQGTVDQNTLYLENLNRNLKQSNITLTTENTALVARNTALENRNQILESRIKALEQYNRNCSLYHY